MSTDEHSNEESKDFQEKILQAIEGLRIDVEGLKATREPAVYTTPSPLSFTGPFTPAVGAAPDTSGSLPAAIGTRDSAPRSFELQNAFSEVKEKYSNRKLHGDLLFSTQRRNVKSDDAPVFSVLAKVAKYCETGLKIVSTGHSVELSTEPANEAVSDCLIVFASLMRYVQDEGVQLVVNKNYDKDWATQYKSIMSGQTDVRAENINAMDRTATILKHRYATSSSSHSQRDSRGRGRGGRNRRTIFGGRFGHHTGRSFRDDVRTIS